MLFVATAVRIADPFYSETVELSICSPYIFLLLFPGLPDSFLLLRLYCNLDCSFSSVPWGNFLYSNLEFDQEHLLPYPF
jgi:hypothetical protein